jgi:hypothetical protein
MKTVRCKTVSSGLTETHDTILSVGLRVSEDTIVADSAVFVTRCSDSTKGVYAPCCHELYPVRAKLRGSIHLYSCTDTNAKTELAQILVFDSPSVYV